jgi:hypothetical protein
MCAVLSEIGKVSGKLHVWYKENLSPAFIHRSKRDGSCERCSNQVKSEFPFKTEARLGGIPS